MERLVPDLVGLSWPDAEARATRGGFRVRSFAEGGDPPSTWAKQQGVVTAQSPAGGTRDSSRLIFLFFDPDGDDGGVREPRPHGPAPRYLGGEATHPDQ